RGRSEGGVDIKAVASPGTGHTRARKRRVSVGYEHHAREITSHKRLECCTQAQEVVWKIAIESRLRLRDGSNVTAAAKQNPLGARFDDDVRPQAGKPDIGGANGEQHQIESAVGMIFSRRIQSIAQLRDLR